MKLNQQPIPYTKSLPARHLAEAIALDRQAARIAIETGTDLPSTPNDNRKTLSLLGDEQQLRGIPAIGRGVEGAIAGTKPG